MSTATYARRKARGVCPCCAAPPAPEHVYCAACLAQFRERFRTDYARSLTPARRALLERHRRNTALLASRVTARRSTEAPTPHNLLACCGQWWPVTQLPLRTPCCGRMFGVLEATHGHA